MCGPAGVGFAAGLPEAWTYRVAVNLSHSRHRRKQAEQRALARAGIADEVSDDGSGRCTRGACRGGAHFRNGCERPWCSGTSPTCL